MDKRILYWLIPVCIIGGVLAFEKIFEDVNEYALTGGVDKTIIKTANSEIYTLGFSENGSVIKEGKIYGGDVFIEDEEGSGNYKNFTEVVDFRYDNDLLTISWWDNIVVLQPYIEKGGVEYDLKDMPEISLTATPSKDELKFINTIKDDNFNYYFNHTMDVNLGDEKRLEPLVTKFGYRILKTNTKCEMIRNALVCNNVQIDFDDAVNKQNLTMEKSIDDISFTCVENCTDLSYIDPTTNIYIESNGVYEDGHVYGTWAVDFFENRNIVETWVRTSWSSGLHRGFWDFNTSIIPDGANIVDVDVAMRLKGYGKSGWLALQPLVKKSTDYVDNSTDNYALGIDCADGVTYYQGPHTTNNQWYGMDLGSSADTDLKNQLADDWFSIGGKWGTGIGNGTDFYSDNSASVPYLQVQWIETIPQIRFEDPTPENNTESLFNQTINITYDKGDNFINTFNWELNGVNYSIYASVLKLMFNFDNVSKVGDSTTNAEDLSTDNNDGTISGAIWTTDGKYNNALYFDGTNDYVSISDDVDIRGAQTGFAVSIWGKNEGTHADRRYTLIERMDRIDVLIHQYRGYQLFCNIFGKCFFEVAHNVQTTTKTINSIPEWDDGEWHHYVGVWNETNIMFYVDGVLRNNTAHSETITVATSNTDTFIGTLSIRTGKKNYWKGKIDEVKFYKYDLTPAQVLQVYKTNLKAINLTHWEFETNLSQFDTYTYGGCAIDSEGYTNCTGLRSLDINACNCPGLGNNWEINMSKYCNITTDCDIGTGNLSFIETGYANCSAIINVTNLEFPPNDSTFYVFQNPDCLVDKV